MIGLFGLFQCQMAEIYIYINLPIISNYVYIPESAGQETRNENLIICHKLAISRTFIFPMVYLVRIGSAYLYDDSTRVHVYKEKLNKSNSIHANRINSSMK